MLFKSVFNAPFENNGGHFAKYWCEALISFKSSLFDLLFSNKRSCSSPHVYATDSKVSIAAFSLSGFFESASDRVRDS